MPPRPRMPPGHPGPPHHELEARLERSRLDPTEEPAFFRSLLEATVYVHAPVSDDSKHLRLVQFRHPDGFDAIPFFTSLQNSRCHSHQQNFLMIYCGLISFGHMRVLSSLLGRPLSFTRMVGQLGR